MSIEIVLAVLEIFGACSVGWLARRLGYIEEKDISRWSHVVIDFFFPLLTFHAVVTGFEVERIGELWPLPFLGLGIIAFGALCGIGFRAGVRSSNLDVRKTFHHLCAINNYGFLPLIIVKNLWGIQGLARLFFMNLGSSIGYWTIGVGLLGGSGIRQRARNILSPPLVALLLALVLCFTGLHRHVPEILLRVSGLVGSAAVPCMLILIGASVYPLPSMENKPALGYMAIVRLVLLPALTIPAILLLPIQADIRSIAIIVALMPASISSTIITRRFGGSPDFAARAAVLTTILSLATIPLSLLLLTRFMAAAAR